MNSDTVAELFARLEARLPEPKTELSYCDPFTLLVAVVLSAQSTDVSVNRATRELFMVAPDPESMVRLGEERIVDYIRTIGLFRTKARHIRKLSEILISQHGGIVPRNFEALEALPGVGRKTAKVVLNVAFGEPLIAVDTHIFRVSNRTGLAPGNTVRAVEDKLEKKIPMPFRKGAHHWLLLHGRYVCKARCPACEACVIADLCAHKGVRTLV